MEVIESAKYQREVQLLPGSQEHKNIQVETLEDLKRELNEANQKSNRRTKLINRGIVISSVLLILALILNNSRHKATKMKKALKVIGLSLSILAFIKGVNGSGKGGIKLDVIEPNGDRSYSDNLSVEDKLRVMAVRATLDVLVEHGIVDSRTIQNRSKALRFRSPKNTNKIIINEIANYGRTI
jgi:hypothetical protein